LESRRFVVSLQSSSMKGIEEAQIYNTELYNVQQNDKKTTNSVNDHFFDQQCADMRINPKQAATKYGIYQDPKNGRFVFPYRTFKGDYLKYIPDDLKAKADQWQSTSKTMPDLVHGSGNPFERVYCVERLTPKEINYIAAKNPDKDTIKYLVPKNIGIKPYPNNCTIDANKLGSRDFLCVVEGVKKAIALDSIDVESVAFNGIGSMRVKDQAFIDHIIKSKTSNLLFLPDGDSKAFSKKNKPISNKRHNQFANAFIRFFEDVQDINKKYKTKIVPYLVIQHIEKGIDDLLNIPDVDIWAIRESLLRQQNSKYFTFIRFNKSKYKKDIKAFYGVLHESNFFEQYRDQIGNNDFVFNGLPIGQFQPNIKGDDLFSDDRPKYIRHLEDPFKVNILHEMQTQINFNQYLLEVMPDLIQVISNNKEVCIDAPTGSGKTRFAIEYAAKTNQKIVLLLPTIGQVKQVANQYKVMSLHGNQSIGNPHSYQVIVATYDKYKHITDIDDRVLFIDEMHNFIDEYGNAETNQEFRADVLRSLMQFKNKAKKVIYLSGTPNFAFIKAYNVLYVKCNQAIFNQVSLYTHEAKSQSKGDLIKSVINIVKDSQSGKTDVVLIDDREMLHEIKRHLINDFGWNENEIEVISRKDINDGETETFNNINNRNTFAGKRLILTTRIIHIGININDTNIDKAIVCKSHDSNLVRQFVARFRMIENIKLIVVNGKEKAVKHKAYKPKTEDFIDAKIEIAKAEKAMIEIEIKVQKMTFDEDDMLHYNEILKSNNDIKAKVKAVKFVYLDDQCNPQIDILKILNSEKIREMETGNNLTFYSKLLNDPKFAFKGQWMPQNEIEFDVKSKTNKNELIIKCKTDLFNDPDTLIQSLKIYYQEIGNKAGLKDIDFYIGDVEITAKAFQYYNDNKVNFDFQFWRKSIRIYMKLKWFGMDHKSITRHMGNHSNSQIDFQLLRYEKLMQLDQYRSKHYKKRMPIFAIVESMFESKIIDRVSKFADKGGGILRSDTFRKEFNKVLRMPHATDTILNGKDVSDAQKNKIRMSRQLTNWSDDRIENLIKIYFDIEIDKYSRYKNYIIINQAFNPFQHTSKGDSLKHFAELILHKYSK
jgi:hypothetical protein